MENHVQVQQQTIGAPCQERSQFKARSHGPLRPLPEHAPNSLHGKLIG
jgi:hypothetical protein